MAGSKSDYLENELLDHVFGNVNVKNSYYR